jgi:hypothetical protein
MTADVGTPGITAEGSERPHRRARIVLATIAVLFLFEIALSCAWPHVIPRLAILPRPAEKSWYDGCNWHHRYFERNGPLWTSVEDSTVRACLDDLD